MAVSETRRHAPAELLSFITNPALVAVVAIGLISKHYAHTDDQFWRWWLAGSFLLVGPSLVFSFYLWAKRGVVDVDISKREDRVIPLLLATLGAVVGSYLVYSRLHNNHLLLLSFTLTTMLVAITTITTMWKISLHTSTFTALVTLLVIFSGVGYAWFYLLVLPIGWARLVLKQHTLAQLIAGVLVGFGITTLAALLFRS